MQIAENVFAQFGRVNAGFVRVKREALVIDTLLNPVQALSLRKEMLESGCGRAAAVINTHYHQDHTGGNCLFGAPVVAHRECRRLLLQSMETECSPEALRRTAQNNPEFAQAVMTPPTVTFGDMMELHYGEMSVLLDHYGGHTPGSSVVLVEAHDGKRVCFAGDLLFVGRYPFVLSGDTFAWVEALARLEAEVGSCDAVVPGHGPLLQGDDIAGEIGRLSGFFRELQETVSRLVDQGLSKEEILGWKDLPTLEDPAAASSGRDRRAMCVEKVYGEVAERLRRNG